jgi:biopolymer transport protein ExbB
MTPNETFGLAHLWAQSDIVIKLVAFTLVVMSVASWYLIVLRTLRQMRARSHEAAVESSGRPAASARGWSVCRRLRRIRPSRRWPARVWPPPSTCATTPAPRRSAARWTLTSS